MDRTALGRRGEELAAALLRAQGYCILQRNWHYHGLGEIDLIAQHGELLLFVEVRTRRGHACGLPEESLLPEKRARLLSLAEAYLQTYTWDGSCRIDVIALELDNRGQLVRSRHIENAVTGWDWNYR